IVPQPNWRDDLRDFKKLGKPRLFFGVSAGAMDSMVNHYTANKRLRSDDAYTPGGSAGQRPDYPTIVYTQILKSLFPDTPVIIGGIEASMRRFTHYDYWQDRLKPSILVESGADLLVYGMGETALMEIGRLMERGVPVSNLVNIAQTAVVIKNHGITDSPGSTEVKGSPDVIRLYSHEECLHDKKKYALNFRLIEEESNKLGALPIIQANGDSAVLVNPPYQTLTEKEIDKIYDLPFTRLPHPRYNKKGPIPAYDMIRHSVTLHRGCFGGCSFCTISAHQGKFISSRSEKSVMKEVESVKNMPDFKGYISDLGGTSANMYKMQGKDMKICAKCRKPSCIFPVVCPNLETSPASLLSIYRKVRSMPGIKKAFVGSGIRYDLFLDKLNQNSYRDYARELIKHHVSGRLKVAPEHADEKTLKLMRKPSFSLYRKMQKLFDQINREENMDQQLIPYFISSHPGCGNTEMAELAVITRQMNIRPEQVQDFTPTPMTLATVIFYTGINPYTMEKVDVAKTKQEKMSQQQFFFWYKKEYRNQIRKELLKMGRKDLVVKLLDERK
ncbi:MAG: YgiQ family radical SAM protein, partial [Bacteroidales bacterium]